MENFYQFLEEDKVVVIPGNIMSVNGKGYEHYIRLNFTKPTIEEIEIGIARLGTAIEKADVKEVYRAS
jgi:2-aminoadipate transaminase